MAVKRKRDPDSWTLEYDLWEFSYSYNQCDAGVQNREGDQCPNLSNPTVPPAPIPPPNLELVEEDTLEGLDVPSMSFSSVLSLSSLSYMSGLSGPNKPLPGLEPMDVLGK